MAQTQKKSREAKRIECLNKRQYILEFIRRNGECDTDRIVHTFGYHRVQINVWLHEMVETGHVVLRQIKDDRIRNCWAVGSNKEPLVGFKRRDPSIRQLFVKAKQIGMARDWAVAAIFGKEVRA